MIRPANLHVLTRDALERARVDYPDALIDVEHRGDGECEADGPAFVTALAVLLGLALAALEPGESLWMRSSGVDGAQLAVDLRWRGQEADPVRLADAHRAAEAAGGTIVRDGSAADRHLGLRLDRWPAPT